VARMIPPLIHPTVQSAAERKLFEVIRDAPGSDDWVCLHSLALARHDAKRRGEVDFLLLTRKGVFVLEVKGGRIARQDGAWVFTNRWGEQARKYESPYQQASGAMFSLERDLRNKFGKEHRLGKLLFGYGVLFPDIVFDDYGTEGDQAITYDLRDRTIPFTTFVDRMGRYSRRQDPTLRFAPTEKDIHDLTDFLRGDFDRVPPLGARLDEVAGRLLELTREQYHVLDAYASPAFPRLVIQGGAGTGKTLLAVECAIREAQRSSGRTLFLCYNRLLAAYLDRVVRERAVRSKVEVWSVYALLNHLIKNSKMFGPEFAQRREGQPDEVVYGVLYPEYAGLAVMEGGELERYETLVVDEGQDFLSRSLLAVLDGLLVGGIEGGRWRVFCDVNNQGAVYGKYEEAAFADLLRLGCSMVLPLNRRNSKEIAQETTMLAAPRIPSVSITPGMPVEYIWYDAPANQPKRLKNLLYRLYQDGVSAGRITVLTPRSIGNSCLPAVFDPVLEPVTEQNVYDVATGAYGATTFSTVSSFKGLENDYIVLVDVENLDDDWWRSVIYVGMSRARAGLCVLVPTSLRPSYEACLRRSLQAALS
jgi:Nuclease-related domain/Uncharacterized conserved protein (DUF2075)